MHKFKLFCLFGVTALAASAAPILIDNFDTSQTLSVAAGGVNPTSVQGFVATGANSIGSLRDVVLTRTSGLGAMDFIVNEVGVEGVAQYNSSSAAAGNALLIWDGNGNGLVDPTGLGGVDLTDGGLNTLVQALVRSDLISPMSMTIYTSAGNFSTFAFSSPGGGTGLPFTVFNLPFVGFVPTGTGADFSNVGAITLALTGPTGLDLQLDLLATSEIPEPATFLLSGTALIGLAMLGRRYAR